MIWRSQRSAKSAACRSENVVGVSSRRCFPRRGLHQRRRIPFREMQPVPANFKPPLEQIELRALARPVRALHDDQSARIRAAGNRPSGLRQCGFHWLASRRLLYYVLSFHHCSLRENVRSPTLIPFCYRGITTRGTSPGKAVTAPSENGELDVQKFLRV